MQIVTCRKIYKTKMFSIYVEKAMLCIVQFWALLLYFYLRQGGNVFASFCVSVCLSVCLCVC